MNLVETWLESAAKKHGSIGEAIKFMSMVSGVKIHSGRIYRMRDGFRPVPAAIQFFMLNEVLLDELDAAGWDSLQGDFQQLRDRLALPERKDERP